MTFHLRRAAALLLTLAATGGAGIAAAGPASAAGCANASVSDVSYHDDAGGRKISITPTKTPNLFTYGDMTNDAWHAVQQCVPGLYGTQADSVYQQILCHAELIAKTYGAAGLFAGATWDAEDWRPYGSYTTVLAERCQTGGGYSS